MTIIKSFLIPKFVYISSLLPTPKKFVKELNQLIFKFLWNGKDKIRRVSVISNYEEGGIKIVDVDSMVISFRLAWLKRIFSSNTGTWKSYLKYLLKEPGGLFLFSCDYDVKDFSINSQFYMELLHWWSKFRDNFATEKDWHVIIWNNRAIRINNKPIFYRKYYSSGILTIDNLRLDLSNTKSFELIAKDIAKTNFLEWTGLRHSIPSRLKASGNEGYAFNNVPLNLSFKTANGVFDTTKKSKDYYALLISKKALFPCNGEKLKCEFDLSDDDLKQAFSLPHSIAFEPYVKAFQYKVLNSILSTNYKLHKIGYVQDNSCSFCKLEPETMHHFLFYCTHARIFWDEFESYYFGRTNQSVRITLKDIQIGILSSECPLLTYLLLIGKLYLWDCRRSNKLQDIAGFKVKVDNKYQIEKYVCTKNNKLAKFEWKWKR